MRIQQWSIADWQGLFYSDLQEWARVYLSRIEASDYKNRSAGLITEFQKAEIIEQAEFILQAGVEGKLCGVPYALKDLFDYKGSETTCGSRFYAQISGKAEVDSEIVSRLRAVGAVCGAKSSMNEFAYGLSGENTTFGNCPHPRFPKFLSGGSSSGSAWAVGAGLMPLGIGTDTGGSIRVPSAWCGLYGLRMMPGLWMGDGAFPLAPSLDTAGWMTSSAQDMLHVCEALLGEDSVSKSSDIPRSPGLWIEQVSGPIQAELGSLYAQASLSAGCVEDPERAFTFREICDGASKTFSVIQSTEAAGVHKDWLDPYRVAYDAKVWGLIDRGRHWTERQREEAEVHRREILGIFELLFETYDYLAMPAVHQFAPYPSELNPALRDGLLALTSPASLAGLPALTIPVFDERQLSGGIQIVMPDLSLDRIRRVLEAWRLS